MTSLQQQIGLRIKELRQLKGYTQAERAELVDLSTNYVGYLERRERTVSLQVLERLAHTLGVEVSTFFLFRAQEASKKSEESDHKAPMVAKFSSFLQHADREDLRLLFKLAKRLVRTTRS
ncbi:MAG: helix-turn-helix transcriptional regulator [Candidatus Omnitrophica bacterium]|nr:helix-turn-helix transcriptional regulator [Candidatus Omnitrophota bacterium]